MSPESPILQPAPDSLFQAASWLNCCFRPGQKADFALPLPSELERAVAKRQTEYLAGRWCVAELYRQQNLNLTLPIYHELAPPQWPAGWIGSISHSQNRAAAAIAPLSKVRALGLDLEFCLSAETASRVRDSILHPQEQPMLLADDLLALTVIFSFKESLYKALNPLLRRFIGFQEVAIQGISTEGLSFVPQGELCKDFPIDAPLTGRWLQQESLVITSYEWI